MLCSGRLTTSRVSHFHGATRSQQLGGTPKWWLAGLNMMGSEDCVCSSFTYATIGSTRTAHLSFALDMFQSHSPKMPSKDTILQEPLRCGHCIHLKATGWSCVPGGLSMHPYDDFRFHGAVLTIGLLYVCRCVSAV